MAFEAIVDSLEGLPEVVHEHFVEKDGKFEIQVNGMKTVGDVTRVQESLRKERVDHKATKGKLAIFGERTPESIEELVTSNEELTIQLEAAGADSDEDKKVALDKAIEHGVGIRLRPVQRELDKFKTENEALSGENKGLRGNATKAAIRKSVFDAAAEKDLGINPDAHQFLGMLSEQIFEQDETGAVVTREDQNDVAPGLSPSDAFREIKADGKHRLLFGATVSANAAGGEAQSGDFKDNPFTITDGKPRSITRAAQMIASDPTRARRLMAAAKGSSEHPAFVTFAKVQAG